MRAVDAQLPPYSAARGLSSSSLAWRVYGRPPTRREIALIARAAQRLVERELADYAVTAEGIKAYFRAQGVPAPHDAAESSFDEDDGVVIRERASPLGAEWVVNVPHHGRDITGTRAR